MKKTMFILTILTNILLSQSVEIKDTANQLLLQINDEGDSKSSITIPSSGNAPTSPTNKLYNEGGTLKWSASALSTGGNTLDQAYDQGGAGEGRTITADAGAFNVGGVDGVLFTGTYNTGTIPTTGAGTRMMWYPKKAAFRAGSANSDQWDDGNIGEYSVAMGFRTMASGEYSTALGHSTTASGFSSTAMGYQTKAESYMSVAIGKYNIGGGDGYSWSANDPLFEIGIGTGSSANANAMTVLKNGNVGIVTATPSAKLDVSGDIVLGESGSRFLEIQEITGTTGVSNAVTIPNALPDGWTGSNTRVLSFEIQYGSATGNWVTVGNDFINTQPSISASLGYDTRTIILYYPDLAAYQFKNWRMVLMKMPS